MATPSQYQRIILYKKPRDKKFYISKLQVLEQTVINLKKRLIVTFILILLISISGCKGKKDVAKALEEIRTGTEGIVLSFLPNAPPDKIHVEQGIDNSFDVVLELKNKGAYPQPNEGVGGLAPGFGKVYLSGYDDKIIEFNPKSFDLSRTTLEGKSTINPNGGLDFVTYKGAIRVDKLNVEKYEPILLATACYYYFTVAGPSVCIDPNPYSTVKEKKVCEVNDITLSNQGAPIAITKIDEEAFATKTQFKITIKNVGVGDVIKAIAFEKCNPFGSDKLGREDIDKVFIQEVLIADKYLDCGPYVDGSSVKDKQGFVRLVNGEGFVICEFPKTDYGAASTAYTTPLKIKLSYVYKNTAEKKIQIKKETSGLSGESSSSTGGSTSIPIEQQYGP